MNSLKSIEKSVALFIKQEPLGKKDLERLKLLSESLDESGRISREKAIALTQAQSKSPTRGYENFISKVNKSIQELREELEDTYLLEVFQNFSLSTVKDDLLFLAKVPPTLNSTLMPNLTYNSDIFIEASGVSNKEVIIFISYASGDLLHKNLFVERLEKQLDKNKIAFTLNLWEMEQIPVGVDFDKNIRDNLAECDYGFTLLSDNFIQSQYIMNIELPILLESDKIFPIGLVGSMGSIVSQVESIKKRKQKANAKELLNRNIFMLKNRVGRGDFFSTCAEKDDQKLFVNELLKSLSHRKAFDIPKKKPFCNHTLPNKEEYYNEKEFFDGHKGKLSQINTAVENLSYQENKEILLTIKIQESLNSWLFDAQKYPQSLYALLGDFGMGKTFNLRMFSMALWKKYKEDKKNILPFYIDLRDIDSFIYKETKKRVPYLEEIVTEILRQSHNSEYTHKDILELHKKGALLLIIDGLDEKLVHYNKEQQDKFLKELMSNISPQHSPQSKTILSCRNHYFETVLKQNNFFLGRGRVGTKSSHYVALDILPLDKDEVEAFLSKQLSKEETAKVLTYISNDEYLGSIASRPFMLSKILELLPHLSAQKEKGEKLNIASFYDALVADTFERDEEKNKIEAYDKAYILQKLSYFMYEESTQNISIHKLNKWFLKLIREDERLAEYKEEEKELLKQDLRNSTLLVRFGDDDFGFSHSSIYEYFLSQYFLEHWEEVAGRKEVSTLSRQFLLDMVTNFQMRERGKLLAKLIATVSGQDEYWVRLSLDMLSFLGLEIEALEITETKLIEYLFKNLKIRHLGISGCDLYRAKFIEVEIKNLSVTNSNLSESYFQETTIETLDHHDTAYGGITLLKSQLPLPSKHTHSIASQERVLKQISNGHRGIVGSVSFSPQGDRIVSGSEDNTLKLWNTEGECLATFEGHRGIVRSVSFSPKGEWIVSGSHDNTLKLWNTEGECLATFEGHSSSVSSVSFSPQGEWIVSGSIDGTLKLWNIEGECLATFEGHKGWVRSVSFSPQGDRIVSGSNDGTLKLWNTEGECLATFEGHRGIVRSVSFSPQGEWIVSGSHDNTLKLWNTEGECLATFEGCSSPVTSVSFSPQGEWIVSGSYDDTLKLWNTEGECLATFEGHSSPVTSVSFSPQGDRIVSGSEDNTLKLWNTEGECLATFEGHKGWVRSVSFSPQGDRIVSGSNDGTLKLWNTEGECLATFEGHRGIVRSVSFSPQGEWIVSGSHDNTLKLWNTEGECLATFEGCSSPVTSVSFSPQGEWIVSGSYDDTLKLWNTEGECLATFEGHSSPVTSVSFSPQGDRIVSGSEDNTLKLWNTEGECLATFEGHKGWVSSVSFSPQGEWIVSGSNDGTLKLWNTEGECLATFEGHSSPVTSVSFSPQGDRIVSGSYDDTLKLWNTEGECLATFEGYRGIVRSVSFSPQGEWIVSGSNDGTLKLWNTEGECLATFEGHSSPVTSVSFSPQGDRIVSGSYDDTLKLWNTEGECLATFEGYSSPVTSVSFSPQGDRIVSGSYDDTLKLWNTEGECLATFEGHRGIVRSVSFSPKGEWIVSGSNDGTVRVWDSESHKEVARYTHKDKEWYSFDFPNHRSKGTPMSWKLSTLSDEEGRHFTIDKLRGFEVYPYVNS